MSLLVFVVLSLFFVKRNALLLALYCIVFYQNSFKNASAAEASESVCMKEMVNLFPHIDAFGRLCSRRLFENIVTKEEMAQNVQFLLLPQCFPLFVIGLSIQLWRCSMF